MPYKVVMTSDSGATSIEEDAIASIGASLIKAPSRTEDLLIANCRDADAVLAGANEPYTERVIAALEHCRVISRVGIGYDNIHVEAATAKGIPVSIVPDYCVAEVSDHAMAFILTFARKIIPVSQAVRAGHWRAGSQTIANIRKPMRRLAGQTLGIVGLGRIGKALARKAQAFGLRVIAVDPYVTAEQASNLGVERVDLDSLLRQSDYISLHALLTDATKKLIDGPALKKMKSTAVIINNARGGLIDEAALYAAVSEERIAGAGIDVTDPEPPRTDDPLLQLDNVLVTAHSSFYSAEGVVELRQRAVEAVVQVLQGGWPPFLANPEVMQRSESPKINVMR